MTLAYRRAEFVDTTALSERMRRDLVAFVKENLAEFQSYDTVAIYYDGGQNAPRLAIHRAFDETLSVNTAEYKKLRHQERRLAQVADFICSIELAALRYADHEETSTYIKLFGGARAFKANQLKQMRRSARHRQNGRRGSEPDVPPEECTSSWRNSLQSTMATPAS